MLHKQQRPIGLRTYVTQLVNNQTTKAVVVGVAAVVLAPVVLPLVKPVVKATLKSGFTLFEKAKGAIAETGEVLADIAAEARAEVQAEIHQQTTLPVAVAPSSPTPADN